jgi:outer membrane receptor protein involved in Fe transport
MKKINLLLQTTVFKVFVICSLFSFSSFIAIAQTKITGKVQDKNTGEALVGVTVSIKGTTNGTSTDLDGKYELIVAPGIYTLNVRYIMFKELVLEDIKVIANEVTFQDILLEETSSEGKELGGATVTAEAKKESMAAVNVERKNAVTVSDGVSSEQFRKTPDRNVSDVLKRVSGTSIQENKFAIIRGMNDRYNAAYLNGAPLPSTESDRKAFAFNIIPSNLIDNLIIYKAPAPDILGDFAGGVIMINTKNIPDAKTSVLNFSTGTHSLTTFQPFSHFRKSKTDVLGFDNGVRSNPESKNFQQGLDKYEYVNITKKFNNDWKVYEKMAMPNTSLSYSWGRSFKHHKNSFGTLASFTYASNNRTTQVEQRKHRYEDNNLDQDYTDNQFTNNVSFGALLNFGYKLKKKHTIAMKNLFNLNTDDITTTRNGLVSGENFIYSRSYSNVYSQNRIVSTQITGDHLITEKKKQRINWVLNVGNVYRAMPDYRVATYAGEGKETKDYTLIVNNNLFSTSSGRFYSDMSEMILSGTANYIHPFRYKFTKNEFKAGVFSQNRNRVFTSRYFTYYGANGITGTPDVNLAEGNISEKGVYMVEQSSPARDNYDAVSNLNAGYLMMDTRLATAFRIVYGVRYENYHQKINTADGSNLPLVIDSTYRDFFPSVNFTWNVSEKTNVRLSAGKTVNRPEFRELSAFPFFNFNLNANIAGNTRLQPAKIWNYDARWEWFPTVKEVISVGVFYKKITNPIEMAIDVNQVSLRTFGYDNQKSADNFGVELEYRKSFDFLTKATGKKVWENLTFFTNLALIKSKIAFNEFSQAVSERPLQGQSPFVVNSGLQFTDTKSGWGANLSYNKIGRRIAFVGAPKIAKFGLDIYENPRTVIDLQISKSFKKWDYKLTAGDLLAQSLVFYQDIDNDKKYAEGNDNTIFNYKMGQTVTAAIAYKFN